MVNMLEILNSAILAGNLSLTKYLYQTYMWTTEYEHKEMIKTVLTFMEGMGSRSNDSIILYLLPLLKSYTEAQLIKMLYERTFKHGLLSIFECLIDNGYQFREDYLRPFIYEYYMPIALDKFLEILFKKKINYNLHEIMIIAIDSKILSAVKLTHEAGCQITDEFVNMAYCAKIKTYLREHKAKIKRQRLS